MSSKFFQNIDYNPKKLTLPDTHTHTDLCHTEIQNLQVMGSIAEYHYTLIGDHVTAR